MNNTNALPSSTRVDEFIIDKVLGGGGFSIVYNAHHVETRQPVVIKEYMPQKLARRTDDLKVVSISENEAGSFAKGQKLFFQEASTLAQLKHKNIVNVITFFPANGTTYMVMDEVKGVNLQNTIRKYEGNLSEKLLRIVFKETLSALKLIHDNKMLHLDIKPGNIHLRPGGIPMLLDFGAVRETQESRLYDTRVVATPGFAPVEQITDRGYLGPWTDIYALGATIRSCIDAYAPPAAGERKIKDKMKPAVDSFQKHYSLEFLKIIDWTMEIDPEARPQDCQVLIDEIEQLPELTDKPVQKKEGLSGALFKKLFSGFKA